MAEVLGYCLVGTGTAPSVKTQPTQSQLFCTSYIIYLLFIPSLSQSGSHLNSTFFFCMFVCAHVCRIPYVCRAICVQVWKPKVNVKYLP